MSKEAGKIYKSHPNEFIRGDLFAEEDIEFGLGVEQSSTDDQYGQVFDNRDGDEYFAGIAKFDEGMVKVDENDNLLEKYWEYKAMSLVQTGYVAVELTTDDSGNDISVEKGEDLACVSSGASNGDQGKFSNDTGNHTQIKGLKAAESGETGDVILAEINLPQ